MLRVLQRQTYLILVFEAIWNKYDRSKLSSANDFISSQSRENRDVPTWWVGGAAEGALTGRSDAPAYILLGQSVAHGTGLSYVLQPTAFRAPRYPATLNRVPALWHSATNCF
jgi:hypothetical protein